MALWLRTSTRFVGLVMGFGTGVLFSAVAFELTREAYDRAGADAVVLGLLAGSLVFFAGDWVLDRRGAEHRKSPTGMRADATGTALALGALLDGIPESAAIGVSLVGGGGVGVAVVAAVFLSNIPEGLSASSGMKPAAGPRRTSSGCGSRSPPPRRRPPRSGSSCSAARHRRWSRSSRRSPPARSSRCSPT